MDKFLLIPRDAGKRRAPIIDDPMKVEARLRELHPDLNPTLLHYAISGGLDQRNEVTPASAPTAAGSLQWHKTVNDLRYLLADSEWIIYNNRNLPFITSPDYSISIVVMTGNYNTGKNGDDDPVNQAEKGVVAQGFIQKNNEQFELCNLESFGTTNKDDKGTQVWVLLYHYDQELKEIRYELSLPTFYSKGRITSWKQRLIFKSIPNNPDKNSIIESEPSVPVTIHVEPKTKTL